jgi:hypothetical protein
MGTDKSVVVRWRTDVATDSRVSVGSAPGNLTLVVDNSSPTTEHEISVTRLDPDTRYYYAVGTTTTPFLAGNDLNHFFWTAPTPGTDKLTRIWVLGDSGTANANARAVRDAYYTFTGTRHTDLWLMLGDNAYNDGTDSEYQTAVFDMYPEMLRKSVLWPTLGNHDGHSADSGTQSGPYYNIFTLPKGAEAGGEASGTEAYYSFDYGNIHFIVLDSFDSNRLPGSAMLNWLTLDLMATTQDWIIAYWHHPPYSKGSHDSDSASELREMRQYALPILEDYGVDLVLAGHSHSYERSFLLDGHYGTSSTLVPSMILDNGDGRPSGDGAYQKPAAGPAGHEGAVYTVAGSSGKTSGGSLNHPVMYISLNVLGSVVLDVDGNRLDVTFLDSTGAVRDTFTLQKGPLANRPPTALDQSVTTGRNTSKAITLQASDANGDPLSYSVLTPPTNGDLSGTAPSLTYTPAVGFVGSDSFTFKTNDGVLDSNVATVSITVTPDTGLQSPTANAPVTSSAGDKNGFQTNPANAYANDGLFAVDTNSGNGSSTSCTSSNKDRHLFYGYGLAIPAGSTIQGIEVRLDAKVDSTSGSPKLCVQLSWNGGVSWTTAKATTSLTRNEATYLLGSASDLWGRTWSSGDFGNTNFRVRVVSVASSTSRDFSLDWVAVRVTYQ